ncbi:MAG: type IV secretory system conjugative DNA transfer family protein [Mogibacterium sp.]|nr:type IV secretory system conjugative DNA transfer family protein [Mogibacterium sp.]
MYHRPEYLIHHLMESLALFLLMLLKISILIAAVFLLLCVLRKLVPLVRSGLSFGRAGRVSGITFGTKYGVDIYSPSEQEGHILAWGPSGSGKTAASLIPILYGFEGCGSFVLDISGDIFRNVSKANQLLFEPENVSTPPFDVFHSIDVLPSDADKNQALSRLAYLLMPPLSPQTASANASFFNDEGRKILTASLIAFYHVGLDFVEVCEKIVSLSYKQLFSEIDATGNELAISYINGFEGASEMNTAGCRQSAVASIDLFASNSYVRNAVHRPSPGEECFTADSVETRHVFFLVSDANLDVYSQLVHLVTAMVLEYVGQRTQPQETILIAIDELASFGRLDLINQLRKARKRKVRIFCLTQSLADLYLVYGKDETQAMLTNYKYKLVLGSASAEDSEYVSRLIGKEKRKRRSISIGSRGYTTTHSEEDTWIISPEEVSRLNNELLLIYPGGHLKLKKIYYFKRKKS